MGKGEYTIKNFYSGGYSSFSPSYGSSFTGYRTSAQHLGMATDARTANVLKEVSENLSAGAKTVELNQVFPEVFESIPKDQLKEVNRLAKLTGVDVTLHAPLVEPSGMTKDGFTEAGRESAERQMNLAIERGHEINPKGNVNITFHSSVLLPGQIKPKGREVPETFVINSESGSVQKLPLKERKFPGEAQQPNIKEEVTKINEEVWKQQLTHLAYNIERASELIRSSGYLALTAEAEEKAGEKLYPQEKQAKNAFNVGTAFLQDSYRELKALYDLAYKNATEEEKNMLLDLGNKIKERVEVIKKEPDSRKSIMLRQEIVEDGLATLTKISIPEIYKSLNDFAKEKTTETFANAALNSYKKFKESTPIISIENPPAGGAFSTAEELKEIIEKSREKFVKKAVESGISESTAKEQAEKIIGATWDVGHINMLRKYGYEGKDIVKESEKIAPFLKHVHLSDNFGLEHTELPMGMGNVPIKEIMEKFDEEGFKGKKIIEAMHWWQHFSPGGKTNPPLQVTLEAFGSPIYSSESGPYWNQSPGLIQNYYSGYGQFLPDVNYQTFGAGFSQLPAELGGQRPGQGSRMSGRGME